MIEGQATVKQTEGLARRHPVKAFSKLGTTGLWVSQAGFGGYRITHEARPHGEALGFALRNGINLIDTSTNYADGGSEILVGLALQALTASGKFSRDQIVVVSKAGYLQGATHRLSQERKKEGRPFPELVAFGEGLEHCIHPEFLADQLGRSLRRLDLSTLDVFLLHNPEYYLEWAQKQGVALEEARKTYYRRIRAAFEHLESEADSGRIGCYGISSNTFPAAAEDAGFTSLSKVWEIAESVSPGHRFRVVQLPFNLLESGAALAANQPEGQSVLEWAQSRGIGILTNRPLNAFTGTQLVRLAEIDQTRRQDTNEIIQKIRALGRSEKRLWRKLLPDLGVPHGLQVRIKQQLSIAEVLTHYWRNFGSYERWRQVRSGNFQPRVQGVIDFLAPYAQTDAETASWIEDHTACVAAAYRAVGSIYAEAEALRLAAIRRAVDAADSDWAQDGTLSQKALRAVRSTSGVSAVLVGMRREAYVQDVLRELARNIPQRDRKPSWRNLKRSLEATVLSSGRRH